MMRLFAVTLWLEALLSQPLLSPVAPEPNKGSGVGASVDRTSVPTQGNSWQWEEVEGAGGMDGEECDGG